VPKRAASPKSQIPLATVLSSTAPGTTHSKNLDTHHTSPHSEAITLLDTDEHQQPQSNEESLLARNPDDGVPHGESLLVRFLLAVKSVLHFRIVNVLLVFMPMGIAVRKSGIGLNIIRTFR
jgi:hypothetical protein